MCACGSWTGSRWEPAAGSPSPAPSLPATPSAASCRARPRRSPWRCCAGPGSTPARRRRPLPAIGRSNWPAAASNGCSTRPFGGATLLSACHGSCSPTGTSSARRWAAAGRRAWRRRGVGANPRPSLVVLASSAAELLALLPFTPGGLGFVEAGLVGTVTVAGVPGSDALAATLLYRLAAYWLPIPAGASRTRCSATATTDAMRDVEFPAQTACRPPGNERLG